MPATNQDRQREIRTKYYIQLPNGNYGRIDFYLFPYNGVFTVQSAINPTGSRNLEPQWNPEFYYSAASCPILSHAVGQKIDIVIWPGMAADGLGANEPGSAFEIPSKVDFLPKESIFGV